jgi:hypothetical protein
MQEKYLEREAWFVLKAKRPAIGVREVARSYDLEEQRDFITRRRLLIDKRRGWEFTEKGLRKFQAAYLCRERRGHFEGTGKLPSGYISTK